MTYDEVMALERFLERIGVRFSFAVKYAWSLVASTPSTQASIALARGLALGFCPLGSSRQAETVPCQHRAPHPEEHRS
eukprot:5999799-Amphidinium_carterae.1